MKILFTSIVGRPNVGKSSLLNNLLEYDLAIVSDKPQATREQLTGILTDETHQIIFTDTPGLHKPQSTFGKRLNTKALKSLKDIDLAMFLVPANQEIGPGDLFIIDHLKNIKNKIAIITKIDLENDAKILKEKADSLRQSGFENIFAVSIKDLTSIKQLLNVIKEYAYEGEMQYEKDAVTDVSEKFMVKEIIREAAISFLKDELPHSIAVSVEKFEERQQHPEKRYLLIQGIVYVKKESQKGIVVGAGGSMIKQIGILAKNNTETKLDAHVNLFLKVKVSKDWVNNEAELKRFGY